MRLRSDLEHYAAAVRSTLRSHAEKSPIGIEDDAANGNAAIGVIGVEVVHNGFRPTSSQRWVSSYKWSPAQLLQLSLLTHPIAEWFYCPAFFVNRISG